MSRPRRFQLQMPQAPILDRLAGRPAEGLDVGENIDRRGDARGGDHGSFGLSGVGFGGRKSDTIAPQFRRAAARPYQGNDRMSKLLGATIALALAVSLAASAPPPPPPQPIPPPAKQPLDAKTQLETGKTY